MRETRQNQDATLQVKDVSMGYGARVVLDGVSLEVRGGEVACLIGPNGAGKSTLLKTIARELSPAGPGGTIYLSGRELSDYSPSELARERAEVFSETLKVELMSARDVVEMGRYPHTDFLGRLTPEDVKAVDEAIQIAGIEGLSDREFSTLSDGQRQRVLLARAIAQRPRLMVLDEPCTYLDIRYRIELLRIIRSLATDQGLAIIASMHELPLAHAVADRIICVRNGRLVLVGTPREVFENPRFEEVFDLEPGTFDPVTGTVHLDAAIRGRRP